MKKHLALLILCFFLLPSNENGISPALALWGKPEKAELRQAIKNLTHKDPATREKALDEILASSYRDPSLVPVLEPLLEDPASRIREQSVTLLGELKAKQSVSRILPLLQDPVAKVRVAAVRALGQLNAKEAIPSITYLLNDNNEEVAMEAIKTLQQLGGEQSVKDLTDVAVNGDSYRLRSAAIRSLGEMRASASVSQLIVLLEYERDIWLRLEIARALSKIGDNQAKKPLMRVLEEVRREANQQANKTRKEVYLFAAEELEKAIASIGKKPEPDSSPIAERDIATKKEEIERALTKAPPLSDLPSLRESEKPPVEKLDQELLDEPELEQPIKQKPKVVSKSKPRGKFTIQIKATPNEDLAKALLEDLKDKGEDVYIVKFKKDNETWHRVRLGNFSNRQQAESYATSLKDRQIIDEYFITQ